MFDKNTIKLIVKTYTNCIYTRYLSFTEVHGKKIYNTTFVYNKEAIIKAEEEKNVCREIRTRIEQRHKNLVNILDAFQDYNNIYVIYDIHDSVCIEKLINVYDVKNYRLIVSVAAQILSAIFYLSRKDIILPMISPKGVEILRKNGHVKVNLDGYTNERVLCELANEYPEYIMPFSFEDGQEPIHPALYSVGIIMKRFGRTNRDPDILQLKIFFAIVFIVNELCDTTIANRNKLIRNDFSHIKLCDAFSDINWENIKPDEIDFLEPKQLNLYVYMDGKTLETMYPTPKHYGRNDGYGLIFKCSKVRHTYSYDDPIEAHTYNVES